MATRIPPGYMFSAQAAVGTSEVFNCTATQPQGRLWWQSSGESAVFNFQASHDGSVWGVVETYTATATQTGTANLTGYYPYVRAVVTWVTTRTAVTTATGTLWVYWSPVK